MEREWSCYRGCQFNEGRMVVTKETCIMEGNGHVREVASLTEGEWSCYGGDQFKGGSMFMLHRWSV